MTRLTNLYSYRMHVLSVRVSSIQLEAVYVLTCDLMCAYITVDSTHLVSSPLHMRSYQQAGILECSNELLALVR